MIPDEGIVKVKFYKLIPIDSNGDAPSLVKAVKDVLIADELWEPLKTKLASIVSDGENTMFGDKNGFIQLFRQEMGSYSIYPHQCLGMIHKIKFSQSTNVI